MRQFLTSEHGFPIEMGDVVGYARTVEEILQRFSSDIEGVRKVAKAEAVIVTEKYAEEAERHSIVRCWQTIIGG